eukprot:Skav220847  [mRNA]  locus=scaffold1888:451293:452275:- [translate_table: standard]
MQQSVGTPNCVSTFCRKAVTWTRWTSYSNIQQNANFYAARNGHIGAAAVLLLPGANIDFKEHGGFTPIFWADQTGQGEDAEAATRSVMQLLFGSRSAGKRRKEKEATAAGEEKMPGGEVQAEQWHRFACGGEDFGYALNDMAGM